MKKLVILLSAFLLWFTPAQASYVHNSVCDATIERIIKTPKSILITYKVDLKNKSAYRLYLASVFDVYKKDLASGDHSGKTTIKLTYVESELDKVKLDCK